LLALPAAGFLVRIFIIQHDCGHGSFLKSRRANDTIGTACSFFTLVLWDEERRCLVTFREALQAKRSAAMSGT
jgi:omega-6 fatty acid desaturase (delta-12 desaturase)